MSRQPFRLLKWSRKTSPPSIEIRVANVRWTCSVTGHIISSTVSVSYQSRNIIEYTSFEDWLRGLAASRPWIAEALVDEVATVIANTIGGCVTVRMEFDENENMHVVVTAVRCPDDATG